LRPRGAFVQKRIYAEAQRTQTLFAQACRLKAMRITLFEMRL
jgi:hypothetical protein